MLMDEQLEKKKLMRQATLSWKISIDFYANGWTIREGEIDEAGYQRQLLKSSLSKGKTEGAPEHKRKLGLLIRMDTPLLFLAGITL